MALGHTEAGIQALDTAHNLNPEAADVLISLEWHRLSLCDWDDYDRRAAGYSNNCSATPSPVKAPWWRLRASILKFQPPCIDIWATWSEPTLHGG